MRRFLLPALLTLFFISESLFVEFLPAEIFNSDRIFVPHFLVVAIFFLAVYGNMKRGLIYAAIFGLLFDIVYTEIIGVYLYLFPLVTYIVFQIMRILQSNVLIISLISIVGVALLELSAYEMNYLIKMTDMDFSTFSFLRLFPTLILNAAFTIIIAYPLKKFFEKYGDGLSSE